MSHNHLPSTALVEKKARFFVSKGFSCVKSGVLVWGSDSPVSEELSTFMIINIKTETYRF